MNSHYNDANHEYIYNISVKINNNLKINKLIQLNIINLPNYHMLNTNTNRNTNIKNYHNKKRLPVFIILSNKNNLLQNKADQ